MKIFAGIFFLFAWITSVFAQAINPVPVEVFSAGSFERASRIYIDKQGTVYVLDAGRNMVFYFSDLKINPKSTGGFGWSAGSFDNPTGITTDGINIYVSDYGNHRIQRFDRSFNYISSFSTRDTSGAVDMRFGYPLDISLSDLGDLFILDGENLRVLKFNPQNFFISSFGDVEAGKGKLQDPVRLFVTTSRVLIGERSRIAVFDYFGNYISAVGEGIIAGLAGFALLENGFIAASSDTLLWFSKEGVLQKTVPLSHLITGNNIEGIQDIACVGNQLYILSQKRLHIFDIGE
ncbi:MAG: NHL repeat-containing protein [Bacteroidetes bacterium]|nr:NHL repeat-containing protein [Bacteroidota bacterium]